MTRRARRRRSLRERGAWLWSRLVAEMPRVATATVMAAIPAIGVLGFGWSLPTVLILVWIESVLHALAMRLRCALHLRQLRGLATDGAADTCAEFAILVRRLQGLSLGYCVLLGVIALEAPVRAWWIGTRGTVWRFDGPDLAWGTTLIAAGLAIEAVLDRSARAGRSREWIRATLDARFNAMTMLVLVFLGYTAIPGPDRSAFLVAHPLAALGLILGVKFLIDIAPVLLVDDSRLPAGTVSH